MAPTAIISCYNDPFYNTDLLNRAQTYGSQHQRYNRGALYKEKQKLREGET